jgi:GNAT superfamily N-acetyltransferase
VTQEDDGLIQPSQSFAMNEAVNIAGPYSTCTIRIAEPRDCEAMAELAAQLGYPCTGQQVRERLSRMQDGRVYLVLVAELTGGPIVGWVGAYIYRNIEADTCVEISGLVTHEDVRSRGIGKMLLDATEAWARSVGCNIMSVRSNVKRDRAHQFYLRNGYEVVKSQRVFRKRL